MQRKKRKDGRLKAAVTIGVKPDGRPLKRYVYARTELALESEIQRLRGGDTVDPGRLTVAQMLDTWYQRHVARKKPWTQDFYRKMLRYLVPAICQASRNSPPLCHAIPHCCVT